MSAFHVGLGALDGELIAVDGFEVEPIRGRAFPVAVAQRLDIRVSLPPGPGAYPVLAQARGRAQPDRNHPGRRRRCGQPNSRCGGNAVTGAHARSRTEPARPKAAWPRAKPTAFTFSTSPARWPVMSGRSTTWSGTRTRRRSLWPRASGSSLCSSTRRRCPTRCICTGMNSRWWRSTASASPGAVRDTILVTPGRRVVVAFDANNPGWWALHCHLLYHLEAGMFTTIKYV